MSVNKKVIQLSISGKLINIFDSLKIASTELNIDYYSISKCCNFKQDKAKGYRFEFEEDV